MLIELPLHALCQANHSHSAAMATLLSFKVPPSQADVVGWTPLHLAAHRLGSGTNGCRCKRCVRVHRRRRECMRLLLKSGSSTSAADARGATPCHLSAAHDDPEGLRLLRAARADMWAADRDGQRPLDVARHLYRPSKFVSSLLLLPSRRVDGGEPGRIGGEPEEAVPTSSQGLVGGQPAVDESDDGDGEQAPHDKTGGAGEDA